MSDLVERIRHEVGCWGTPKLCGLLDEAANEIERLMNENEKYRNALINISEYWCKDKNTDTMEDACWHNISIALDCLEDK